MESSAHTSLLQTIPTKIAVHRKPKRDRKPNGPCKKFAPKKGGAGGKGVWGKPGDELSCLRDSFDRNDPNYDSEAEPYQLDAVAGSPMASNEFIDSLLQQYFASGIVSDIIDAFEGRPIPSFGLKVLTEAVLKAFDRKDCERELVSLLICDIHSLHLLSSEDICGAFEQLLLDLSDIRLDTPDAGNLLARFIARCVGDECISPSQLSAMRSNEALDSESRQVLERAETLLTMNHGFVRVDNIWGVAGGRKPVKVLTKKIVMLLSEFLSSNDVSEAERCVRELDVPHFHHEIAYEAIVLAMQGSTEDCRRLVGLLSAFSSSLILTPHQIRKGFQRAFDTIDDLVLDYPNARKMLQHFATLAIDAGINVTPPASPTRECAVSVSDELSEAAETAIARGRKRYVSTGDGGVIKA